MSRPVRDAGEDSESFELRVGEWANLLRFRQTAIDLRATLEDIHGILRDPERPYPFFPDGCPAPLREGIEFTELCGACPMQAEGVAKGRAWSFYARYGTWNMEIERAPGARRRAFSGDDRWYGHMPPSVAFALITSKLLWHVCGPARLTGDLVRALLREAPIAVVSESLEITSTDSR